MGCASLACGTSPRTRRLAAFLDCTAARIAKSRAACCDWPPRGVSTRVPVPTRCTPGYPALKGRLENEATRSTRSPRCWSTRELEARGSAESPRPILAVFGVGFAARRGEHRRTHDQEQEPANLRMHRAFDPVLSLPEERYPRELREGSRVQLESSGTVQWERRNTASTERAACEAIEPL